MDLYGNLENDKDVKLKFSETKKRNRYLSVYC